MNVAIKKEFQGLIQRVIDDESDGKLYRITPSMVVHMALEKMFDKTVVNKKNSQIKEKQIISNDFEDKSEDEDMDVDEILGRK